MGNGFNYVREIMQMNLPDIPSEQFVGSYNFIGHVREDFIVALTSPFVALSEDNGDSKNYTRKRKATAADVIMYRNELYAWCTGMGGRGHYPYGGCWLKFEPGPCTRYVGPIPKKEEKEDMAKHNLFDENDVELTYIGRSTTEIVNGSTAARLRVEGTWIYSKAGYIVMYDDRLYVCAPDGKWYDITAANVSIASNKTSYNKIPYGFMTIKNVVFNCPATIVMWEDGTKTIVKCGDDEEFDWEKGLAMAIAKKTFGNQGNYFNQIKKWKPETEENDGLINPTLSERLNRVFGDPRIADAKKKLAAVQDMICDMTFNGATKAELVRAIKYSKDLIDFCKGVDVDIDVSAERYGVIELEAKYQPK